MSPEAMKRWMDIKGRRRNALVMTSVKKKKLYTGK